MAVLRTFILRDDDIAQRAGSWVRTQAPPGSVVTVSEPTRNSAINAALHARLGEIAERRTYVGKKWPIEVWKRLLVAAWSRAIGDPVVMLPALDGAGVDIVFRRTSEMTQAEVRELLAFIEAWDVAPEAAA
jgi:hypothetical protein